MAKRAQPKGGSKGARGARGASRGGSRGSLRAAKAARARRARRARQAKKGTKRATKPRTSTRKISAKHPNLTKQRPRVVDTPESATPPSSLTLERRGSAVRSGRADLAARLHDHIGSPALTAGDVDADWENAYFTGDEAPGGDNPTPDQEVVEEIGRALGVEYQDNEELKGDDKVAERDRHRWELDPASSEDYKERK
jgi:hypothetical protein